LKGVKFLLQEGADPNLGTMLGCAPVKFAEDDGYRDVVEVLKRASATSAARRKDSTTGSAPFVSFLERQAVARAAEEALLAELEAEKAAAAALKKTKKRSKEERKT